MNQTGNKTAPSSFLYQRKFLLFAGIVLGTVAVVFGVQAFSRNSGNPNTISVASATIPEEKPKEATGLPVLDSVAYTTKLTLMANGDSSGRWPVKRDFPTAGAIFPFNRIVAFYGNLYSKRMGILGELPRAEMLKKLRQEVANWQAADTLTPVIPALHYIAVTAQGSPGKGSKYRLRMPFHQIDSVISMASSGRCLRNSPSVRA